MRAKYWAGAVGAKHAVIGRKRVLCAFSHGKLQAISKLMPGDRFAYYAPPEGYSEGEVVQAFVATGTVSEGAPFETDFDGYTASARAARYNLETRASVRPFLESLVFVSNPKNWGMAFRRSLFEISAEDFALVDSAMRQGA
ncbi:MAG: EVE domain-containing protein [Paracoccaceae bacterium]